MREAGYDFEVLATDADETAYDGDPAGTVARNALAKLAVCRGLRPDAEILAADTLVWFEGHLVGKPRDEAEAARFLRDFSGRRQTVFTAVAFSRPADKTPTVRIEASIVRFKELSDGEIADYIRIVQPLDRAGAYDAADYGDRVIAEVIGSFTNVVGLPMDSVRMLLGSSSVAEPKYLSHAGHGRMMHRCRRLT